MLKPSPASAAKAAGAFSFAPLDLPQGFDDLVAILDDLRVGDRRELLATLPEVIDDYDHATQATMLRKGSALGAIFHHDDMPAAAIGFYQPWRGVWEGWSFGTRGYRACMPAMAEWCRGVALPAIDARHIHRVQVKSIGSYAEAHRWIEWLGLSREGEQPRFGRDGEDFVTFAWVRS